MIRRQVLPPIVRKQLTKQIIEIAESNSKFSGSARELLFLARNNNISQKNKAAAVAAINNRLTHDVKTKSSLYIAKSRGIRIVQILLLYILAEFVTGGVITALTVLALIPTVLTGGYHLTKHMYTKKYISHVQYKD